MATETFGQRLRRLRQEAGLSQKGLEGRSGVSDGTIKGLEQGRRQSPTVGTLLLLSRGLGVDVASLIGGLSTKSTKAAPRGRPRKQVKP